jgi:hypothetical protein
MCLFALNDDRKLHRELGTSPILATTLGPRVWASVGLGSTPYTVRLT